MRYIPQDSVRFSDKVAYCIGAIGKDLVHGLVSGSIFIYSFQVLGIPCSFLITIFVLGLIFKALTAPIVGTLIDNSRSILNRYKFWVMLGSCLNMLLLVLLFFIPVFATSYLEFFLATTFIFWNISFNFIDLPYWAIISNFNTYSSSRNTVAAIPCISRHLGLQSLALLLVIFFARQDSSFLYITHHGYLYYALSSIIILFLSQGLFLSVLCTENISFSYTPDYRRGHGMQLEEQANIHDTNCCVPPTPSVEWLTNNTLNPDDPCFNYAIINANQRHHKTIPVQLHHQKTHSFAHQLNQAYRNAGLSRSEQLSDGITKEAKLSRRIKAIQKAPHLTLKSFFDILFKNDQLLIIIITNFLQNFCFALMSCALFVFFLERNIYHQPNILFIILAGSLLQLFSMSTFKSLVQKTNKATIFISSIILINIGFALLLLLDSSYDTKFYSTLAVSIFIMNCGIGLVKVGLASMTADSVDYSEFKLSLRTDGSIFAAYCLASHFGLAFAFLLYFFSAHSFHLWLLQSPIPLDYSWLSLVAITSICSLLGLISILLYVNFYKLNGAFYRNILNNLQFLRLNQRPNIQADPGRFMLRYSLDTSTMFIKLKAKNQDELIHTMVHKLVEVNAISSEHDYMKELNARLELSPCGIAEGIAIPHAKSDSVHRATVIVATLDSPIDLGAFDNQKCDLIFLLASPDDGCTHLNLLGRLSLLLNEPGFADKLRSAGSPTELFDRLAQCEKHIMH